MQVVCYAGNNSVIRKTIKEINKNAYGREEANRFDLKDFPSPSVA
jgi:hypothetical protein